MLEILSPAGSFEAVIAAVQSGADAVYLGLDSFNARRGAKNFSDEEFVKAVEYCHERGAKVYVTLNTLAADREMQDIAKIGAFISEAGADAAIVQDLGVVKVLRSVCPDLPIHASTQMSIHNLAGAMAAHQMGISRVVLARELSLQQIAFIARNAPVEVEVFVHGALCFCHSGQCYMSALIGRRSGNRGLCAQPCRMQYSMGRKADEYPLSLKDNCLISHIEELEKAGVACVKIEGRMKRPEYTAIVTGIYSKVIHDRSLPTESDLAMLEDAFSRSGFTDGYFTGKKEDMFGIRTEPDKSVNKLFAEHRKRYTTSELRRVGVDFYARIKRGENIQLLAVDSDGHRASVMGPAPENAQHNSLTQKAFSDQLYKTGGTPYRCGKVTADIDEGVYLSAAAINALRRKALEELSAARLRAPVRRSGFFPAIPQAKENAGTNLNIQVLSAGQLTPELAQLRPRVVYVPAEVLKDEFDAVLPFIENGSTVCAVLPRVITDSEAAEMGEILKAIRAKGISQALCGNLGHIALARACGFEVRGDFGLNVFNSFTLQVIGSAGLLSATASFELRLAQVRDMIKSCDTELIVYGRLPCMVTEQCIIKRSNGSCSCTNVNNLSDRKGSVFPVVREFGCRNVIYNAHKLYLGDKLDDIAKAGLWGARLMFTTESPRECVEVTKSYMGLSDYTPNGLTRGLYYRGVE